MTTSGAAKFTIKFEKAGDIHFESVPSSDRDGWVAAIKAKVEEAKANAPAVLESEGYKTALEKLGM